MSSRGHPSHDVDFHIVSQAGMIEVLPGGAWPIACPTYEPARRLADIRLKNWVKIIDELFRRQYGLADLRRAATKETRHRGEFAQIGRIIYGEAYDADADLKRIGACMAYLLHSVSTDDALNGLYREVHRHLIDTNFR
jgi:hypothetical protein